MPMPSRELVQGAYKSFIEQIVSAVDGRTPSADYLSSDVTAGTVWWGDDQTTLLAPAVSWVDATIAKFKITFPTGSTGVLDPSVYRMQCTATRGADVSIIFDGMLEVLPTPGLAKGLLVYITSHDLETYMPAVRQYFDPKVHQSGFLEQRAQARFWFEDILYRSYRGGMGIASTVYPQGYPYRYLGRAPELVEWLENDNLVITEPIKKCQVWYTASLVFGGLTPSNPELFQKLETIYFVKADRGARQITAELSSDGTQSGVKYAMIDLSSTPCFRG